MPDDAPATTSDRTQAGAGRTPVAGAGGVVIRDDGHVLVLRRCSGAWVFPKGHLDPGEDHLAAALREVAEEAGVHATCDQAERTWTTRYRNDRGIPRQVTWFRLRCPEGTEPLLQEALFPGGAFLPPEQALSRLSHDADRELLRAVLACEQHAATSGARRGGGATP